MNQKGSRREEIIQALRGLSNTQGDFTVIEDVGASITLLIECSSIEVEPCIQLVEKVKEALSKLNLRPQITFPDKNMRIYIQMQVEKPTEKPTGKPSGKKVIRGPFRDDDKRGPYKPFKHYGSGR